MVCMLLWLFLAVYCGGLCCYGFRLGFICGAILLCFVGCEAGDIGQGRV